MESIYHYLDYREFLKDYYAHQKSIEKGFSYRRFAEKVGVKASNFLLWLIDGTKNLPSATTPKVVAALGLSSEEGEYFSLLVAFNQSSDTATKKELFEQLSALRHGQGNFTLIEDAQFEYFDRWYNSAIRELFSIITFDPQEKWAYRKLARKVLPHITESQARQGVKKLLTLGLLVEGEDGIIRQADAVISTADEVQSLFVKRYHEEMLQLAKESIDRFESSQREISGVSMAVSDECFLQIKHEIQRTRKRILELIQDDTDPQKVYQLNMQLFPMGRSDD